MHFIPTSFLRSFVTADTSAMRGTKTTGSIIITAKLDGTAGWVRLGYTCSTSTHQKEQLNSQF